MTIRYRDAGPDDAACLSELGQATFIETFGRLYSAEDLASFLTGHSEEAWREQLGSSDYAVRIAEEDGRAVAYAKLGPMAFPIEAPRPAIELYQLYVLGPWQGQGVSHRLMRWIIAEARRRGAEDLYLSVWTENHRARRFYERYGFRFVAPYAYMVGQQADEDEIWCLALEETA
jgi:GNAT superfamily N-acetyltransferase